MFGFFSHSRAEGQTALGRHAVKSAMTPIFWITTVSAPSCFGAAYALGESPVAGLRAVSKKSVTAPPVSAMIDDSFEWLR